MNRGLLKRSGVLILLAIVVGIVLAACGSSSSSSSSTSEESTGSSETAASEESSSSGEEVTIGSFVWGSPPYFTPYIEGQEKKAKELGVHLILQNANEEQAQEVAFMQQYIAQGVNAILSTPSNSEGIVPATKQANAAGIPVIADNTEIPPPAEVVTYVGSNNVEYGEKLAEATVEQIGEKGKVAVILGLLGSSPEFDRKTGFENVMKKYPEIEVLEEQTASWENAKALAVTQDFLNKYGKGELNAIVDQGPEAVPGAEYAAKNGRSDVKFIVGDIPTAVQAAIEKGLIQAAVYQNPAEQGEKGIEDAVLAARGEESKVPSPKDFTPTIVVTKKNLGEIKAY
jgi:ABC-type sugar transport system substrate-binding protein